MHTKLRYSVSFKWIGWRESVLLHGARGWSLLIRPFRLQICIILILQLLCFLERILPWSWRSLFRSLLEFDLRLVFAKLDLHMVRLNHAIRLILFSHVGSSSLSVVVWSRYGTDDSYICSTIHHLHLDLRSWGKRIRQWYASRISSKSWCVNDVSPLLFDLVLNSLLDWKRIVSLALLIANIDAKATDQHGEKNADCTEGSIEHPW